ncbi:MAG: hypothetical protein E7456_01755 [Ruminococcaceae bacterium]|nr:hypothetical protein [Oscillospiraceae bacterium]
MLDRFERMDMSEIPAKQRLFPLLWLYTFPHLWKHGLRKKKVNMKGIKPPYLMLCNHNAFIDFRIAESFVFPRRCNYVAAVNAFVGREELVKAAGAFPTRRFNSDIKLVRQLKRVVDMGRIAIMYPEARYTLCGTPTVLPDSLGKLVKLLKVPVVVLISNGVHVNSPFWNIGDRKLFGITAEMTCILTAEEVRSMKPQEINERIREAFVYDDFAWQKKKKKRIKLPTRAEGLHRVLYQCPGCGTEYKMTSEGSTLRCTHCGREWEMTELGELKARSGETEFSHIPDWYEWERKNVRAEVRAGKYHFDSPVRIEFLPNSRGYVDIGNGTLRHDYNGLTLEGEFEGEKFKVEKPVVSLYSCQIEYDYKGCGQDCVGISTTSETFYVYPQCEEFSVTKISLAVEEMYVMEAEKAKTTAN